MGNTGIIIFATFFVIIMLVGGFVLYKLSKATKAEQAKQSELGDVQQNKSSTAQSFLPFDDIEDGYIKVGDQYRIIMEISSINYNLLSENERNLLEGQFKTMIDSMKYLFAFYIQTRQIDTREVFDITRNNVEKLRVTMPSAVNYGNNFLRAFRDFSMQDIIIKKKYIIITSDPILGTGISEEDKKNIAFEQLQQRYMTVKSHLSGMRLQADKLEYEEILELIKLSITKTTGGSVDGIVSGEFMNDKVTGKEFKENPNLYKRADDILTSFENTIETELVKNRNVSYEQKERFDKLLKQIQYLKRTYNTDEKPNIDYYQNINKPKQSPQQSPQITHIQPMAKKDTRKSPNTKPTNDPIMVFEDDTRPQNKPNQNRTSPKQPTIVNEPNKQLGQTFSPLDMFKDAKHDNEDTFEL